MLQTLAQASYSYDYSYSTSTPSSGETMLAGGVLLVVWLVMLAFMVFLFVAMWKLFTKAGRPGWASIVPIYNLMVQADIAGKPMWWGLVVPFVPVVGFVLAVIMTIEFVKRYGKDTVFGVLSIFFSIITYPMLAFGSAKYQALPGDPNATLSGAANVPQQPVQPTPPNAPMASAAQPVPAAHVMTDTTNQQPPAAGPTVQG